MPRSELPSHEGDVGDWFRTKILVHEDELRNFAGYLTRYGFHADDVDDILHDAYARLISNPSWPDIVNPIAYAKNVIRNLVTDAARRRRVVSIDQAIDKKQVDLACDRPGPESLASSRSEIRYLQALIEELPAQCRRVFTLCKVYGLSHAEIAQRLGLSVSTVEKHIVKGLRFCGEKLDRHPVRRRVEVAERREPAVRAPDRHQP